MRGPRPAALRCGQQPSSGRRPRSGWPRYEQNLQNARAEANQIVARAQKTATARGEEIVGEARAQAAALKQKAEADIAQERKKAVNEAKDEIGGMAMEIASKVVEREIKEADHKDLIDEFIKNVGEAS